MNTSRLKLLLTLICATIFNLVFWNEKVALNLVIFDLVVVAIIFSLYPDRLRHKTVLLTLAGHVFALTMVLIHNTDLSVVVAGVSLFLLAAFAQYSLRSVLFAFASMIVQAGLMVAEFAEAIVQSRKLRKKQSKKRKGINMIAIPFILLITFFVIYVQASPAFAKLFVDFTEMFWKYFGRIFELISWSRVLFFLAGLYISGTLVLRNRIVKDNISEDRMNDSLVRARQSKKEVNVFYALLAGIPGMLPKGTLALKNKTNIGLYSFVLLNVLLLVINITDVNFIWMADNYGDDALMSELVHEGTEILILSILMAIAVVLVFFDGNINFYNKSRILRIAAMIWLVQNVFLTVSVFMRDLYYIDHYGLAYKRIALIFFLFVVITGLISVMIKISYRKSNYYLFRVTGNIIAFVFIISVSVNWDLEIAKYNLGRIGKIHPDTEFLVNLSDDVLPVLRQYEAELLPYVKHKQYAVRVPGDWIKDRYEFADYLLFREEQVVNAEKAHTWMSWNFADQRLLAAINNSKRFNR
ncbi:MAG: DUF4173 domain-containing protein [Flavitalea sp.]